MKQSIETIQINSNDPKEAINTLRPEYGEHSRVPAQTTDYYLNYLEYRSALISMGKGNCQVQQTIHAAIPENKTILHIPLEHLFEYQVGHRRYRTEPGQAMALPPKFRYTVRWQGEWLALACDSELLLKQIDRQWPGRRGHGNLQAMVVGMRKQEQALIRDHWLRWEAQAEDGDSGAVEAIETNLIAWLADKLALEAGLKPLSPRNRERIDQLVDWVDQHLGEPIDLGLLAKVSGIGPRGLTKICLAARGMAPMELVKRRRLLKAHQALASGKPEICVSDVAHDCGLSHLGRFARNYCETYGELPSQTIKRSSMTDN